ncbi:retrovirus-related pol polyprotein from transposon TNT 1-94 [Tanacetum coccineum]
MFIPNNSTVPNLQTAEDLQGDALLDYDAEMELMNLILLSIPNGIYNYVDACTSAKEISITQNFSTPTKNHLRTSSNTKNQAIIQGDRVNIQSRSSGNAGRNNRRAYVQEEIVEGSNAPNETENVQRTLRTSSSGNTSTVQCYNCNGKGYYARNCPKPRVQDSNTSWNKSDNTSDAGPSYDSAFISERQLARNADQEAEKQQIFAQKVQKQNTTLTSQLELYKERVRVLENINGDNNYLNEFLEADKRAKHFSQQAQSQFVRDRDIIRDLEKQQDKLDLDVKDYKRQNEELQKTHSILKRQMSENEDKYHDTILNLEAKLEKRCQLKLWFGVSDPYTSSYAISQSPKFYLASGFRDWWSIDYAQINALYKDFVPQKELSAEQKYFPSSFIPSDKNSNATPSIPTSMPSLGHNLFSVGQFCDDDLEVAFRSKTCYVRNLEGDDLLTGGRESNLYTISISDMAASSPVCLMSKATSTKSCLNKEKITFVLLVKEEKSKKASHPLKLVPSDHSKLELLYMDLCGPLRVASINGKKYILVIVDDYSRYTWVYFLHSKDKSPEIIKKFIAQAQLNYKAKQNGVVERRNRTLVEAARTMLIFSRLPEFLWAEATGGLMINQEDSADFDGNSQFVPYNPPSHKEIESSTTTLEPSNVQNFHEVQPSTHIWTKDHPLDLS